MDDRCLRWQCMFVLATATIMFTSRWLRGRCRVQRLAGLLGEVRLQGSAIIFVRQRVRVRRCLRRRVHHHGIHVAIIRQRRKGVVSWLVGSIGEGILTTHGLLKEGWLVSLMSATLSHVCWPVNTVLLLGLGLCTTTSCCEWARWQGKVLSNLTRAVLRPRTTQL